LWCFEQTLFKKWVWIGPFLGLYAHTGCTHKYPYKLNLNTRENNNYWLKLWYFRHLLMIIFMIINIEKFRKEIFSYLSRKKALKYVRFFGCLFFTGFTRINYDVSLRKSLFIVPFIVRIENVITFVRCVYSSCSMIVVCYQKNWYAYYDNIPWSRWRRFFSPLDIFF